MLKYSFIFVSVAIIVGFYMLLKKKYPKWLPLAHLCFISTGAILAIIAAYDTGAMLLWANICLAVVVFGLGIIVGLRRIKGTSSKIILKLHIVLASICYLLLVYNVLV